MLISLQNSFHILYKYCQKITVSVNWFFGRQYWNCLQQNNQTQSIELTLFTLGPICEVVCLYIEWPEVGRNVATPGFVLRPHDLESCRALWLESGPRWLEKKGGKDWKGFWKIWKNCQRLSRGGPDVLSNKIVIFEIKRDILKVVVNQVTDD